jgi:uncharacterized protein (TIGR02598 family)
MKRFIQPFRAARCRNAFTLIEVVIALAVTTFCILILLGMLPVGVNTAQSSRRETRAAYLAEQIVGDLRSSPFTNSTIVCLTNGALAPLPSFSLATNGTCVLACDGEDNILAMSTPGFYTNGIGGTSASYLVQVTVQTNAIPDLSSVSVEVSAPAQAALIARSRFGFQTTIGNRQ